MNPNVIVALHRRRRDWLSERLKQGGYSIRLWALLFQHFLSLSDDSHPHYRDLIKQVTTICAELQLIENEMQKVPNPTLQQVAKEAVEVAQNLYQMLKV